MLFSLDGFTVFRSELIFANISLFYNNCVCFSNIYRSAVETASCAFRNSWTLEWFVESFCWCRSKRKELWWTISLLEEECLFICSTWNWGVFFKHLSPCQDCRMVILFCRLLLDHCGLHPVSGRSEPKRVQLSLKNSV